jgi:malonate decarboxylase epsilon subunit
MERACADGSWGMAALRGLGPAAAQRLIDSVATERDPLCIANVNAADQIVVSGTSTALRVLRRHAPGAGARDLTDLDVGVASHCPLQASTARSVAQALARAEQGEQHRGYFANTTGRRVRNAPQQVLEDLAQSVRRPVRWYDAVRLMPELGVTATVQVPPGRVLTAISARENPALAHVAVDDAGLEAAVRRAAKASGPPTS